LRIVLATLGTAGDVRPFVVLGAALEQRGHDVTLATNGYFEPQVRGAGLAFISIGPGEAYREAISGPGVFTHGPAGVRRLFEGVIYPAMQPLYELIRERHAAGPLAVAASTLCFGARMAQEKLAVPTATVHLQPTVLRGAGDLPSLPGWLGVGMRRRLFPLLDRLSDRLLGPNLNPLRQKLGLPPARGILGAWMHSPRLVIALFPSWYAAHQPDWPPNVRQTGFLRDLPAPGESLPPGLDEFLAAGAPPVVFTPGTGMAQAEHFLAVAVQVCSALGRRGLLLTPHLAQVPPALPQAVRQFDHAPFAALLPRCAGIVHHGGAGTIAQALAAGIPQLVVPWAFDQPDGAARVVRLGVGGSLRPAAWKAPAAATALWRLLVSPEVALRCREVAARMAEGDPLSDTCALIETLAEEPTG
jgi:rhamnosyltransferase subunit B